MYNASRDRQVVKRRAGDPMPAPEPGRTMPQAAEIEEAVLGALLLEKQAMDNVVSILRPEMFYDPLHRQVFEAMRQVSSRNLPCDALVVGQALKGTDAWQQTGWKYLTRLTARVSSAAHIEYHALILAEAWMKREMIRLAQHTLTDAYDPTYDAFELVEAAQNGLQEALEVARPSGAGEIKERLKATLDGISERSTRKGGLAGTPSGYVSLDRQTSGFVRGDLYIVAARPGMGKTAFVLSSIRRQCMQHGQAVAIMSLEMSGAQLLERVLSAEAEIDSMRLRDGRLDAGDWNRLVAATERIAAMRLHIVDAARMRREDVQAEVRKAKRRWPDLSVVYVDYLQLLDAPGSNREQQVAHISRGLKILAKEENVAVVALAQLSRDVEKRGGGKKPQLSDLRDSGQLEQDADFVGFLYRPEYYGIKQDELGQGTEGLAQMLIEKNRAGSTGVVDFTFRASYVAFDDRDTYTPAPDAGSDFGPRTNPLATAFNYSTLPENDNPLAGW